MGVLWLIYSSYMARASLEKTRLASTKPLLFPPTKCVVARPLQRKAQISFIYLLSTLDSASIVLRMLSRILLPLLVFNGDGLAKTADVIYRVSLLRNFLNSYTHLFLFCFSLYIF